MTLLFNCQSLSKSFGTRTLFTDLSFSIFSGDRIGLIGPNGSGKSTLLKIVAGIENPDSGSISPRKNLIVGYVPQSCEFSSLSPSEVLKESFKSNKVIPDYEKDLIIETWLTKMGFTGDEPTADKLSGGWKKRLGIAQELIHNPDLLLLDEPTNHLDLEGILWLEKFLKKEAPSYVLISHDRYFLKHMTNRIVEIDRVYPKGMFALEGSYSYFLEKKEEFLKGQLEQERSIANKARRELEWLRKSPKARTTKSQSRIDDAYELFEILSDVQTRNKQRKTDLDFTASHRDTRKLVVAKNLSKSMGKRLLFKNLDFTLSPGTRIGLMGPNGSGKTTLLKIIGGEIQPDQGTLKNADNLKIVYFDQHRTQIPLHLTLREALSPTGDFVDFRGQKIHVNGWCKRFLFEPNLLDLPVGTLSGGERARISIAHLMLQPADILLLDEPTNDLDIPTLETLEETLQEFPGAVVLITHDRCMLDRICNSILAFGDPNQTQIFADYIQWEKNVGPITEKKQKDKTPLSNVSSVPTSLPKIKLTHMEKKELGEMESKISTLEKDIQLLNSQLESASSSQDASKLQQLCTEIALLENQIEQHYLRWEELEKKSNPS